MEESFSLNLGKARLSGLHRGKGEAIIFLHAGIADKRMWLEQLKTFSNRYHVIAYDRRGFGETITPDEAFSHLDDLQHVIEHFKLPKVILVGCSQGGRIAIDFALRYQHRVTALVLIAPAISGAPSPKHYPEPIEEKLEALEKAEEKNDLAQVNVLEANLWLDGPLCKAGRANKKLQNLFLDMNGIALRHPELNQEVSTPSAYERLTDLAVPTLILWGDLDFPHIQERCHYLAETLPFAKVYEISGTAHLPNLEESTLVNNRIQAFLGEL